jgi:hypothetical protein
MSEMESKLGKMSFESTETRMFEVPDESGYHQEPPARKITAEEAIKHRQEMQRLQSESAREQISTAKTRIEMLVGIGRAESIAEISGVKFHLRTLKGREMKTIFEASTLAQKSASFEGLLNVRTLTLALSIFKIDDVDVDLVLGLNTISNLDLRFEKKMDYLNEFDETLLQILYNKYKEMSDRNNANFGIKDESDAKEVSKEMKKSGEGA